MLLIWYVSMNTLLCIGISSKLSNNSSLVRIGYTLYRIRIEPEADIPTFQRDQNVGILRLIEK